MTSSPHLSWFRYFPITFTSFRFHSNCFGTFSAIINSLGNNGFPWCIFHFFILNVTILATFFFRWSLIHLCRSFWIYFFIFSLLSSIRSLFSLFFPLTFLLDDRIIPTASLLFSCIYFLFCLLYFNFINFNNRILVLIPIFSEDVFLKSLWNFLSCHKVAFIAWRIQLFFNFCIYFFNLLLAFFYLFQLFL